MKIRDSNTIALDKYELEQEKLENKMENFEGSDRYNELVEQEFKLVLLDENIFWEALGYEGYMSQHNNRPSHESLVNFILDKDDTALGKEIRLWIEHYVRDDVQTTVNELGVADLD